MMKKHPYLIIIIFAVALVAIYYFIIKPKAAAAAANTAQAGAVVRQLGGGLTGSGQYATVPVALSNAAKTMTPAQVSGFGKLVLAALQNSNNGAPVPTTSV